jgi:hypothetical protein
MFVFHNFRTDKSTLDIKLIDECKAGNMDVFQILIDNKASVSASTDEGPPLLV